MQVIQAAPGTSWGRTEVPPRFRRLERRRALIRAAYALRVPLLCLAVFTVLTYLPGRTEIAPRLSSDYCYQLLAANRLHDGLGFTSLQPVAPLQPWNWEYDWGFLTQWPAGYSLLVYGVRCVTGGTTLDACGWINAASCALALVGWCLWVRRSVPHGVIGWLLALVAAGCSVSVAHLINPSTDIIVVALTPWILGLVLRASAPTTRRQRRGEQGSSFPKALHTVLFGGGKAGAGRRDGSWGYLAAAGVLAGGLFWIRYASVFLPIGVALYLIVEWWSRGHLRFRHFVTFAVAATVPIVGLISINLALGNGGAQSQMNLGNALGFHFTVGLIGDAWWNFTAFGFYDHHRLSHWVFAWWPAIVVGAGVILVMRRTCRLGYIEEEQAGRGDVSNPGSFGGVSSSQQRVIAQRSWLLAACVVASLLGMLIGVTTAFGDKFDYVALGRYYQPVKPLYFALFVSPVVWWLAKPRSVDVRPAYVLRLVLLVAAAMLLLAACSWLVRYDWSRTYQRWMAADRERTPSGWWARCFTPGAPELYQWLTRSDSRNAIIFSNFHEYLAVETGLPVLPIPERRAVLNDWIERITRERELNETKVLFILDPKNKWRDYWQPSPDTVIRRFSLEPCHNAPELAAARILHLPMTIPVAASTSG